MKKGIRKDYFFKGDEILLKLEGDRLIVGKGRWYFVFIFVVGEDFRCVY